LQSNINKPAVKLRMFGKAGESESGKASNNGVTSCNWDLLNEVAAKLDSHGQIRYLVRLLRLQMMCCYRKL